MNANGVLGSMCFPTCRASAAQLFGRPADKELARACCGLQRLAHRRVVRDASRPLHPARDPAHLWDPEVMADEVRRVAKKGCHAITFSDNPGGSRPSEPAQRHWDPFWKACDDEGTVVCVHIGSGTRMNLEDPGAPIEMMITGTPITLVQLRHRARVLEVLPEVPGAEDRAVRGRDRLDPVLPRAHRLRHEHHHRWTHQDFGGKKPSDVFREHIVTCFIDDAAGVRNRDLIGIDTITWECDYPHSDSTWPNAPETLWASLAGVPDEDIHKITWQNTMRHFRYDPFAVRPREKCTVGALREEARDVDLSLKSAGGAPPAPEDAPFVTIGHVTKQLASAFATPLEAQPQD
jgi:hypothetical protein